MTSGFQKFSWFFKYFFVNQMLRNVRLRGEQKKIFSIHTVQDLSIFDIFLWIAIDFHVSNSVSYAYHKFYF